MKRLLQLAFLLTLAPAAALGGPLFPLLDRVGALDPKAFPFFAPAEDPSWTVVQHTHATCVSSCVSSSPYTINPGFTTTGAGHVIILLANIYNNPSSTPGDAYSSCQNGGTYSHNSATDYADYSYGTNLYVSSFACYTLSSTSGSTSPSMTLTYSHAGSSFAWSIEGIELAPPGTATYDTAGAAKDTTSQANQPGISLTLNAAGHPDAICQSINASQAGSMNATPITGGAGYTTAFTPDVDTTYAVAAYACALNTSTGSAPTWQQGASGKATVNAIAIYSNIANTASMAETNTASDSTPTRAQTLSRGDSETNTASDSLSAAYNPHNAYSATPSETNIASDSAPTRLQTLGRDASETNTASDSLAAVESGVVHNVALTETNTASDSAPARAAVLWRGNVIALYWQASAGGAGNSSYTYSVYRGTSSGGEGSNPIASGLDAGCSGYASCLYLDYNISPGMTYYYEVAAAYSGATSPVSSEVALQAQPATVAETHTAGDALGKLAGHFASLAESNTAADTLGRQAGFNRADSETNTTSDLVARLATWLRGDSETNTALDTLSALHGGSGIHNAVMSETLALSDALARLGVFGRSDSETNAAGDSLGRSAGFARPETEPGGTSDVLARTRTAFASLIEIDSVGDSLARLAIFQRAVGEYDVLSDVVIFVRGGKVVVLPQHAGAVPGRTKTGTAPPH